MKKTSLIALIAIVVAAFAATTASAKPVKPGPSWQDRAEPAQVSSDPSWPGIALAGGVVALAIAGIAVAVRRERIDTHGSPVEHAPSRPTTRRSGPSPAPSV